MNARRFRPLQPARVLILSLLLSPAIGCLSRAVVAPHVRPLSAVLPFEYKGGDPEYAESAAGLSDALAAQLVRARVFRIIERQRVDALLREIHLQATGAIDPKTFAGIGEQLGAEALLMGSVTSVSVKDEWRSVKIAEKTTRTVSVEGEARLVSVQTGEVLAAARAVSSAKSAEKHAFGGKTGELASKKSLVDLALQGLSEKLARELERNYSGK